MQRLSGVLMVLAGTALGGYMVLPSPQFRSGVINEVPLVTAALDRDTATLSLSNPAMAAPVAAAQPDAAASAGKSDISKTDSNGVRVFSPAAPLSSGASTWTAVVTSEPTAQGKMSSPRPGDSETRAALASDLQRELKRVGCYGGEITGTWTPSTKRAMSAFMDRVNATLPVDEPDYILLTLVQGHTAVACSADCPSGQVYSNAGRCVPNAVVAQATRKSQRDEDRRASEQLKAQQQERLASEQRAADAKRIADARKSAEAAQVAVAVVPPAPKPAVRVIKPQQTAAVAPPAESEKLPWLADDAPGKGTVTAPAAVAVVAPQPARNTPLPGMMSVGGPRVIVPEPQGSVAAVAPAAVAPPQVTRPAIQQTETPLSPAPRRAVQSTPVRQAAISGMPGTKSGPAVRRSIVVRHNAPVVHAYRAAKIVRRPPPVVVYAAPKPKYYASNSGGKIRRGQPRPGSMHYNVMQSLGGIY
ncbi:MAG: peptidoglycan-binding domain-containing protein [Hyphomicrobium sp.]